MGEVRGGSHNRNWSGEPEFMSADAEKNPGESFKEPIISGGGVAGVRRAAMQIRAARSVAVIRTR